MKIEYRTGNPVTEKADLLLLPVYRSNGKADLGPFKDVDKAMGGVLARRVAAEHFGGRVGHRLAADSHGGVAASRVVLMGVGEKAKFDTEQFRRAVGQTVRHAESHYAGTVSVALPASRIDDAELVRAAAEGALLGSYRFEKYKDRKDPVRRGEIGTLAILGKARKSAKLTNAITLAETAAAATNLARDLVNEPAGVLTPTEFAKRAKKLAGRGVTVRIHSKADLQKLGAHSFLGVAVGSDQPPCMIELRYKPKKATKKKLAVIGKGITFDSGGLSLKPPGSMETMKCDMGGGAAVCGLFHALRELQPGVEVIGLIGATENMPGGHAQRPGDVVRSLSGKTIEVLNTDAEGRLVLADVLAYASSKHKPDAMVDLATLTGACVVALGDWTSAAYGNDKKVLDSVLAAAKRADEKMWPMPLDEDLRPKLDSPIADVKNIGDRWGGSITAALFLREFVGETPWVHLDIAGPAFAEKTPVVPGPLGGTGYGVRTLIEWVRGS